MSLNTGFEYGQFALYITQLKHFLYGTKILHLTDFSSLQIYMLREYLQKLPRKRRPMIKYSISDV
jgi:hypothetical protein